MIGYFKNFFTGVRLRKQIYLRLTLKGSDNWSGTRGSNPRPSPWQGDALAN